MRVTHLSLRDFRSYAEVELALDPGVTALVGPNGQGKTNLVEAVGYVATLGSHRVAADAPLVRLGRRAGGGAGAGRARRPADAGRAGDQRPARPTGPGSTGHRCPAPARCSASLRTVLFAPEDLALVKGDPAERRRFLDDLLVPRAPRFAGVRADYDRVLKQRNALLKSGARHGGPAPATCARSTSGTPTWRTAGAELLAARLDLVDALRPLVDKAYEAVAETGSGTGPAAIDYRSSLFERRRPDRGGADAPDRTPRTSRWWPTATCSRRRCSSGWRSAQAELERGVSLVGPHRDDLVLRARAGCPPKGYASHGESWSFALALRLASYDLLRASRAAASRCWSSTTSSPSSTTSAARGWPSSSPAPSRCW